MNVVNMEVVHQGLNVWQHVTATGALANDPVLDPLALCNLQCFLVLRNVRQSMK